MPRRFGHGEQDEVERWTLAMAKLSVRSLTFNFETTDGDLQGPDR